ncbi:ATP-binding protein [Gordonia sp. (in: high G+C Gram-positive bacteria)]|uniref:ATP-binding protein n=1 Tax=Gordonia sp. (in: high G+C Gram-positive bacteria) TaxID=84139 RepID=UPI0016A4E993|nr:ATP-binding protein [Gordonia sp. (in: high G+C Gram-positive bacteria)]NLG46275.1 ATP-binding protein [Gordonia sp. (in: high G+C Gram-positive bacteria)]
MASDLPIGTLLDSSTPASLNPARLNRHTFWCGQSGSGKTYSLGVLLEQVLLHTRLPIVVLDPNSDFVRIGELRDDVPETEAAELAKRNIRVLHSAAGQGQQLKVKFLGLDVRSRAALLQLDPILDKREYNTLLRTESAGVTELEGQSLIDWLRASGDPDLRDISLRIENLGVTEWDMWAYGDEPVTAVVDEQADATVVDLGSFGAKEQMQTAALAVLEHLWNNRHERVGRLVVLDEAHNLCSPEPSSPLEELLTERIVQIAAEGRKYGIWLLLSTQRPSKVHPNALSQCDNLALMRMSSANDLAELGLTFGYAPAELLDRAMGFKQGQALFAGGFAPEPQVIQVGKRLTEEGGSDVAVPLR